MAGKRPRIRCQKKRWKRLSRRRKKLEKKELVGPLHVPVEPLTSQAVEDAFNAALQNQPDRAHGQPLRVKCCQVKRKKGHAFQLRCDLCQHGTCSWRGTATCKPGRCMVESLRTVKNTHGSHGRPKQAKGPAGPKSRASARSFTINDTVAYKKAQQHNRGCGRQSKSILKIGAWIEHCWYGASHANKPTKVRSAFSIAGPIGTGKQNKGANGQGLLASKHCPMKLISSVCNTKAMMCMPRMSGNSLAR